MNVIIPFNDLDPDVREKLKNKCIKENKTLREIGEELIVDALESTPDPDPALKKGGSR